jgi:hypothetical protein
VSDEGHPERGPSARVMRMLADGVPLSLLVDLFWRDVPSSWEILEAEGLPDGEWWLPRRSETA